MIIDDYLDNNGNLFCFETFLNDCKNLSYEENVKIIHAIMGWGDYNEEDGNDWIRNTKEYQEKSQEVDALIETKVVPENIKAVSAAENSGFDAGSETQVKSNRKLTQGVWIPNTCKKYPNNPSYSDQPERSGLVEFKKDQFGNIMYSDGRGRGGKKFPNSDQTPNQ